MSELNDAKSILTQASFFNRSLIVYDTETTGLNPNECHVIQLAGKILNPDLSVSKDFNFYINPGYLLPEKIIEITGYTDKFLKDKPHEEEVFEDIYEIFGNYPVVIGHNVQFDNGFMEAMYERNGAGVFNPTSICTCKLAREMFVKGVDLPDHKLSTIAGHYGIDVDFHKADADVLATYEIFLKMIG